MASWKIVFPVEKYRGNARGKKTMQPPKQFLSNSVHNLDFSLLVCYKKYERLVQMENEYVVSGTGRKEGDVMNKIRKDDPSCPDDEKPIQEKMMNRLTGMVICWSSHVAGQKSRADAIQEIRSGAADIAGWLDTLEGLSDHGREQ